MVEVTDKAAHDQTILVYLLLLLHPLFGITALIGVIICHTKKAVTDNTVYASHRTWQIWTFWTGAIGYVAGAYYLWRMGTMTILIVTFVWMFYRIAKGWWHLKKYETVGAGEYP